MHICFSGVGLSVNGDLSVDGDLSVSGDVGGAALVAVLGVSGAVFASKWYVTRK